MMVLKLDVFSYHVELVYDVTAIVLFGLSRVSYAKMHFQIGMPDILQDLNFWEKLVHLEAIANLSLV